MAQIKKKGNKEVLETVNYSFDIIKKIKDNHNFTKEEKEEILYNFTGLSKDNNSYWTPIIITKFIHNLITKDGDYIADLAAGIGNFAIPIKDKNIKYDLYEYDENTSLAGSKAWEDYSSINYIGNVDTLALDIDKNKYDVVTINPPFVGTVKYENSNYVWNTDNKGNVKKKGSVGIVVAFINKAYEVTKDNGYIAMVLPTGFLYKGNVTEKLRNYLSEKCDLKLIIELDADTFAKEGIKGTGVTTVLIILQKCKSKNNKIIYAELNNKDDLTLQLDGIVSEFKKVQTVHYLDYVSSSLDKGVTGVIKVGELKEYIDTNYNDYKFIGKCHCCNKEIIEEEIAETIDDKFICLECFNDEYTYIKQIKPLLGLENTATDNKTLRILEREKEINKFNEDLIKQNKVCYFLSNSNGVFNDYINKAYNIKFLSTFTDIDEDEIEKHIIKCRYNYLVENKSILIKNFDNLEWVKITYDGYKVEHQKVKKPNEKEWHDRVRKWHYGTIETSCDLYNTTWGMATYDKASLKETVLKDNKCIYVNYNYICSYAYRFRDLIRKLIEEGKIV